MNIALALETEHLPPWGPHWGNIKGLLYGDFKGKVRFYFYPGDVWKKALESGISLHMGPSGEPGVGSFTMDFERQMKEGSGNGAFLSVGAL